MRISVYEVLNILATGMTNEDALRDFPELELDDFPACLAFAADRENRVSGINVA